MARHGTAWQGTANGTANGPANGTARHGMASHPIIVVGSRKVNN